MAEAGSLWIKVSTEELSSGFCEEVAGRPLPVSPQPDGRRECRPFTHHALLSVSKRGAVETIIMVIVEKNEKVFHIF